jgi:hypothetical protein
MKILLSSLFLMLSIGVYAEGCNTPEWVSPPRMESKILILRIKTTCTLDKMGNFESLKDFFVKQVTQNSNVAQVFSTNENGSVENLPATEVDSAIDQKAEDDDLTIRYITKVGTNGSDTLVFDQESKQFLKATGNAKYVTKLYTNINLKNAQNGAVIEMVQETRIRKPSFAPEGMFISEASKGIKKGFNEFIKDTFQEISVNF